MKKVLAVLLVLGLAGVAQAATANVEFVPNGDPITMAGGSVQPYTMQITLPGGGIIKGLDIGYDAQKALNGSFSGSFYQTGQYYVGMLDNNTPILGLAGGYPADIRADTHWNFTAADLAVVNAAVEDNDWSFGMTSMMFGEGIGTYLALTAGIPGNTSAVLAAANIAVLSSAGLPAPGTTIGYVADAAGTVFDAVVIPEPATLSLLVLGGLSLIRGQSVLPRRQGLAAAEDRDVAPSWR